MFRRATWISAFALALIAGLVIGCGAKPQPISVSRDAVVLAFGDSLTKGHGAREEQAYPAQLAQITGLSVINAGVNGETTVEGLQRLPGVLDTTHPDLVLLCLGGNDLLRKRSPARMRANLASMIDMIRGRGIAVVLIAVPEPVLIGRDDYPAYAELAEAHGIPLIGDVMAETLARAEYRSDRIHPNAAGYRLIAERIAARLELR